MVLKMAHVFISYVRENKETVDRLCKELRDRGVNVWLDREQIRPGERWQSAIRVAIQEGGFYIACFSPEYAERTRTYMNKELIVAVEELRKRPVDRSWFIPVRLSECGIPNRQIGAGETLGDIQWVDVFPDWDAGVRKILSVVQPEAISPPDVDAVHFEMYEDRDDSMWPVIPILNVIFLFNLWFIDRSNHPFIPFFTPDERWESVPIFGLSLGAVSTIVSFRILGSWTTIEILCHVRKRWKHLLYWSLILFPLLAHLQFWVRFDDWQAWKNFDPDRGEQVSLIKLVSPLYILDWDAHRYGDYSRRNEPGHQGVSYVPFYQPILMGILSLIVLSLTTTVFRRFILIRRIGKMANA